MADVEIKARLSVDTNQATNNLKSIKNEVAGTGGSFTNLKSELKNLGPELAKAAGASNIFNQALNVLKANPIILVLSALAGVIVVLFERFKKMEAVTDSLGKVAGIVSGVFERFLNGVLTPLIDGFTKIVELVGDGLITVFDALGISSKETAERFGEITEALDDLEDSQRDSAIAMAESNRKLMEAREVAADANVPIKDRIAALREAARIEKEELDKVVEYNRQKASLTMESIAMEMGARDSLIKKIRDGSLESLKAARAELMAMKNVDKEKLSQIDAMIIAADNAAAQSAKIATKTQKQITGIEREEQSKRDAANKEAESKRKAAAKEREIAIKKEGEDRKKAVEEAEKYIHDAELSLMNKFDADRVKAREEYQKKIEALRKVGFEDISAITREYRNALAAIEEARRADQLKKDQDKEAKKKEKQDKDIARMQAGLARMNAVITEAQEAQKQTSEAFLSWKEGQAQRDIGLVSDATNIISEIAGRQSKAGKAFAVANALIGTYSSAQAAYNSQMPPPGVPDPSAPIRAAIAAGVAIASGLLRVKTILAVQTPGGGGISANIPGGGNAASAPLSPTPMQTYTTLNPNSIQAVGNAAAGGSARAYVVESDIANGQERIERLNRAARIG